MRKSLDVFLFNFLWITEHLFGSERLNWKNFREQFYNKRIKPWQNQQNQYQPIEILYPGFIDREFLKSLPTDRPVVLKGLLDRSGCIKKWNWEFLREVMSETSQAYTDTYSSDNFHSGTKKASEILDSILSDEPRYSIMFSDMLARRKELFEDLDTENWIDLKAFKFKFNKSWQFFAAGKNRNTNLHSELGSTLVMQVVGQKRWVLFSPKYSMNIYPRVNWKMYIESNYFSNFSDAKNKNLGIEGYETVLNPGDILFFPACFWHFITNETPAVSVSFKWTESMSFFRLPFLSSILLTSRNPSALFRLPILKHLSHNHPPKG